MLDNITFVPLPWIVGHINLGIFQLCMFGDSDKLVDSVSFNIWSIGSSGVKSLAWSP